MKQIGLLFFWFFLGTSLRKIQVQGLQADPIDWLVILAASVYLIYAIATYKEPKVEVNQTGKTD